MMGPAVIVSGSLKLLILTSICLASGVKGEPIVISLALPIRCELGVTCFVQNYVDHKDSDKARDYRCGGRIYHGHDGTDIRSPNLEIQSKGVEVLAAAPGRIVGVRDGVDDISVRIAGKAAVAGRQCGNGAVIEHENGWQTQYCHMAKGSLRVKLGDQTVTGHAFGKVCDLQSACWMSRQRPFQACLSILPDVSMYPPVCALGST